MERCSNEIRNVMLILRQEIRVIRETFKKRRKSMTNVCVEWKVPFLPRSGAGRTQDGARSFLDDTRTSDTACSPTDICRKIESFCEYNSAPTEHRTIFRLFELFKSYGSNRESPYPLRQNESALHSHHSPLYITVTAIDMTRKHSPNPLTKL